MCVRACLYASVRACMCARARKRKEKRERIRDLKKCECAYACMCDWFANLVDKIELASMMYT